MGFSLGFWATVGGANAGAYELIATANGTGSSGTITFSSIPSTYKHLQIRGVSKNTGTSTDFRINFNSDTSTNHATHRLVGNGSTMSSGVFNGTTYLSYPSGLLAITTTANAHSGVILDILDYTSTTKNKTVRLLGGYADSVSSVGLYSGLWINTSAISSIDLKAGTNNFSSTTRFSLYGIKG